MGWKQKQTQFAKQQWDDSSHTSESQSQQEKTKLHPERSVQQGSRRSRSVEEEPESVIWTIKGKKEKDAMNFNKHQSQLFLSVTLSVCCGLRFVLDRAVSIVTQVVTETFDESEIVQSQIAQSRCVVSVRNGG